MHRPPDRQHTLVQLDIRPAQRQGFSTPRPQQQGRHVERVQPIVPGRLEQRLRLLDRQWLPFFPWRRRDLDQLGHVPRQQLLPDRVLQRDPERRMDVLDHSGTGAVAAHVVEHASDVPGGQLAELPPADPRNDVQSDVSGP
jgi:hypothetical protein